MHLGRSSGIAQVSQVTLLAFGSRATVTPNFLQAQQTILHLRRMNHANLHLLIDEPASLGIRCVVAAF